MAPFSKVKEKVFPTGPEKIWKRSVLVHVQLINYCSYFSFAMLEIPTWICFTKYNMYLYPPFEKIKSLDFKPLISDSVLSSIIHLIQFTWIFTVTTYQEVEANKVHTLAWTSSAFSFIILNRHNGTDCMVNLVNF